MHEVDLCSTGKANFCIEHGPCIFDWLVFGSTQQMCILIRVYCSSAFVQLGKVNTVSSHSNATPYSVYTCPSVSYHHTRDDGHSLDPYPGYDRES